MNIVICDDDKRFVNKTMEYVNRFRLNRSETITVRCFLSGREFLDYYEEHKNIDLIFLDILMDGINGIQVAEKIREESSEVQIIFLTSISDYVFEGYGVKAKNYLLKPINYGKFCDELESAILQKEKDVTSFYLEKNHSGVYKLYYKDILFVETYKRKTLIHVNDKENVVSYKNMKEHIDWLEQYDFYRIHESYIINLKHVRQYSQMNVTLQTGDVLPMSKSRRVGFMEVLSRYYCGLI